MKYKIYIICAAFTTMTVSAQIAVSDTVRLKDNRMAVIANQNSQAEKGNTTRSITNGKTKGNWSKIKDMFK